MARVCFQLSTFLTLLVALPALLHAQATVSYSSYRGWDSCLVLSNGKAEAVIVPEVGRVMQFHFTGQGPVFWENDALGGRSADPTAKDWANFGGDKTWPAPQADWEKMIGRGWPPPATFDSTPLKGSARSDAVELDSPVDPHYGIRARRRIELDPKKPVLRITTTYEKISGDPVKVGIGVITQLRDPERVFLVVPPGSKRPGGYTQLNFDAPKDVKLEDGMVSLVRAHDIRSLVGADASTLLWMDDQYVLRIDSPRVEGAEYANQGASGIIYTNADPDAYVELETYGPLSTMKVGDQIERTNTYTLSKRTGKTPEEEAKKTLGAR